jgi:hypothetical protein
MGKIGRFKSSKAEACSELANPERLSELALDFDPAVQRAVAKNPRTPSTTLERLSHSKDKSTRECVAGNPATTSEQLRNLRSVYDPQLERLLARHPQSPPDLLETLSHSADRATRRHVARHPATPKDVLLRLAPQFPGDFLHNPVVDWLLMEEPDLLQTLGKGVIKNVLKSKDCPESLMGWAVRHGTREEQLAITMNPSATHVVLQALSLIKGSVGISARAHVGHPKPGRISTGTSRLFVKEVQSALSTLEADVAVSYWRRGLLGPAQWTMLSAKSRAAVMGLSFPLAEGREPGSAGCRTLAMSPQASASILAHLAKYPDSDVRGSVAGNPNAPTTLLESLATDTDKWVKNAAIGNPNMAVSVLEFFAKDPDGYVRGIVARNHNAPTTLLDSLALDKDTWVKNAAIGNPNMAVSLLESFAKDSDSEVRKSVAGNPNAPTTLLESLAMDKDTWVKNAAIGNPNMAVSLLESFAKDSDSEVRKSVAGNPNAPTTLLDALAMDTDKWVCHAAVQSSLKKSTLARQRQPEAGSPAGLIAASDPNSPPDLLAKLARRCSTTMRWTLASNPSTPEVVRVDLVRSLVLVVGFQGLPCAAQNTATALRGHVHHILDSRHWWHKLQLQARRHGYPRLPARLSDADLVERFQHEEQIFLGNPQASLAAEVMGIPKCKPFHLSAASICKALKETLYRTNDDGRLQLVGLPRLFALAHANAPVDALVKAYRSVEWLERMAVARNLDAPQNLLVALKKDANRYVSRQAVETEQLQRQFQQWPNLAKRVCDSWQISVAGVSQGVSIWDGYSGETSEMLEQLNLHRKTLESLASDVSRASSSLDRVVAEIVTRLRNEELMERMWIDPAWVKMVDIGGLWDWLNGQNRTRDDLLGGLRRGLSENQWNRMWELGASLPSTDIRALIAAHPFCPTDILETLARDVNPRVLVSLANNANVSEALWLSVSNSLMAQVGPARQIVAEHPNAPAQVLDALSHCSEVSVRRAVERNPATSSQCQISLATDDDLSLRVSLAGRHVVPSAALEILSRDGSPEVRRNVALNPNVSSMVLTELSGDQDEAVRCSVAKNPNSLPSTLAVLSRDGTPTVRRSVAENLVAPSDVLAVLSQDLEVEVRRSVAKNPGVSLSVIETLSKDADDWVREGVIENPHVPLEIAKAIVEAMRKSGHLHRISWNTQSVASNPATQSEYLGILSESYRPSTRCAVAANAATPANALEVLSKDSKPEVREQIARRRDIPIPVIEVLAKDKIAQVRLTVAQREDLPPSLVKMLALDKDAFVRLAVATSPSASPELVLDLLAVLAQDKDQRVRRAVAGHPSASLDLLQTLVNDDEKDVRRTAVERLSGDTGKLVENTTDVSANLTIAMQRVLERADQADSGQLIRSQQLKPSDVLRALYWLTLIPQQPTGRFLSKAVGSPDWLTRLAVALHPKASIAQRKLLSQDSDLDVAAAARLSLTPAPISP